MWLIGIYVPGMAAVNEYFIPPNWYGPLPSQPEDKC